MSVTLHTTLGDIKIELFCDRVRKATFNFLALASTGKYDGTVFHRCIPTLMIQGGDPTGTGKGGQSIWGEPFADEFHAELKHDKRGVVSMVGKKPDTNRSQFFITFDAHSHLDNVYTVIGHVIHGLEVLDAMEKVETNAKNRPVRDIVLKTVTVHANPFADSETVIKEA